MDSAIIIWLFFSQMITFFALAGIIHRLSYYENENDEECSCSEPATEIFIKTWHKKETK